MSLVNNSGKEAKEEHKHESKESSPSKSPKSQPWLSINTLAKLMELLHNEQERVKSNISEPQQVEAMKKNVKNLPDLLKHGILRLDLLVTKQQEGMEELYPELAKYVITLTNSVAIIHDTLCTFIKQEIVEQMVTFYAHFIVLLKDVQRVQKGKKAKTAMEKLVAILWEDLKHIRKLPLDNKTGIGRRIMASLSLVRDAKNELKTSIIDFENESLITRVPNPFTETSVSHSVRNSDKSASHAHGSNDTTGRQQTNITDLGDDDDILDIFMDDNISFTELESIRLYQCETVLQFVDKSIHHIYSFLIKHFKEDLGNYQHRTYLQNLCSSIEAIPACVDDLCVTLYPPQESDLVIREHCQALLAQISLVTLVAESNKQFVRRRMVVTVPGSKKPGEKKGNLRKVKRAMKASEWKEAFDKEMQQFQEVFGTNEDTKQSAMSVNGTPSTKAVDKPSDRDDTVDID